MKAVTAGEDLFFFIRDDVLDTLGQNNRSWASFESFLGDIGGRSEFSEYLEGVIAIHALRRLLRFWDAERDQVAEAHLHVKKVAQYVREEVFVGLGKSITDKLARLVIRSHTASKQSITPSIKKEVLRGIIQPKCYLCGWLLNPNAAQGAPNQLTLEHVWPQSIGGDSIEKNLLPACLRCQQVTKDTASWQWLNVHNFVLPPSPSEEALIAVDQRSRYAAHYFRAVSLSRDKRLTLKAAFLKIGPMQKTVDYEKTGHPVTFFDLILH